MADFCYACYEQLFGDGINNDMRGLCAEDECIMVLCEGCGAIWVDHNGRRVSNGTI